MPGFFAAEDERLHADGLAQTHSRAAGLPRDLQDLHVPATLVQTSWTVVGLDLASSSYAESSRQLSRLTTRMKAAAPQALLVTP